MKNKKPRIFIGLGEVVGVGITYADAFKKLGYDATYVTDRDDIQNRQYKTHQCLNIHLHKSKFIRTWIRFKHFLYALFRYDCFIFIFGKSLLPRNMDLPVLKFFGKKIVVAFLGCDIRQRYKVAEQKRPSAFCDECNAECSLLEKKHKASMVEKYADLIIAQEEYAQMLSRDFLYFWMPIDLEEWNSVGDYKENEVLKIAHAPSHRAKKGTRYVLDAINRLQKEGYKFEFELMENIPNSEFKKRLSDVDIMIDQVLGGWYGKLSVEVMALQKVVLTWIHDPFKVKVPDVPILSTSKDQIYENLKYLMENQELRKELGIKGRKFVEKHHGAEKVVSQILEAIGAT